MLPRHIPALRGQLLLSTFAIALIAAPASAQEAATEDAGVFQMLGRLIFGAGTAKVAIDTPQAVTALEQADIDQKQPSTLSDLLKGVPGVQTAGASARPLGQAFNIRGIGATEQAASEDRIKVTIDGAPKFFEGYRMGAFFGDLELFKRVEILRGPASSTLYGTGTIGGVVAFTTKDASDFLADGETTALRFKGSYGSNGDSTGLGVIAAHRAGNAEFLFSLHKSDSGVVQDGNGNDILGTEFDGTSALVKGKFNFGDADDQSLTLSYSRSSSDLKDTQVVQTGGSSFFSVFGLADIATTDDTATVTYNNGFAGNDLLDLNVQLSYTNTTVEKDNFHGGMFACGAGNLSILCDSNYSYETFALKVENTADLSFGGWKNFVTAGVQLSQQERTALSSRGNFAFHPEGTDSKAGVYAQGEFTYNDRFVLIPGIRFDFGDRDPSAAVVAAGGEATSDTAMSASLAALYKFNDTFAAFASYSTTERMPTLDELYTTGGVQSASFNLKKEKAETIELGFTVDKENLISEGDVAQLKLTAFHNDLENLITRNTGGPAGSAYYTNVGKAAIWGAELEASYDAERWFAGASWSSVKSKNRVSGTQLAETPAETVSLTLGVKIPDQNLSIGWRGYYFDEISTGAAFSTGNAMAGDSYDTHDLFVSWKPEEGALKGLDVNFAVENMFDKAYINNLALDNGVGRNYKLSVAKTVSW